MSPIVQDIERQLPHLRRYARAMSGNRDFADRITEQALLSILGKNSPPDMDIDIRVNLFRALQDVSGDGTFQSENDPKLRNVDRHLSKLPPNSRDAFLLCALENFTHREIATILRREIEDIAPLIASARADLTNLLARRILVIEDELQVAQEISDIVTEMGHYVIGSAPTTEDAVEIAEYEEPDLILSDIQLANGGSGIHAVNAILKFYPLTPVVYITGFPERLLSGKGPKPAFLVTKPYTPDQVRSAVSQAIHYA